MKNFESIHFYLKKWQSFSLVNKPINKSEAEIAVRKSYNVLGYEDPEIVFCHSLKDGFEKLLKQNLYRLEVDLKYNLSNQIWNSIKKQIDKTMVRSTSQQTKEIEKSTSQRKLQLFYQLKKNINLENHQKETFLVRCRMNIRPEKWIAYGSQSDFYISTSNCDYDFQKWEVLQLLVKNCGCILSVEKLEETNTSPALFKKMAIVCDSPRW